MKRVIPIVSVFALLLSLTIVASAYGVQNVFFDGGFWTNTLEVNFYVGAPSSGEYNTKKSTVNQSYYIINSAGPEFRKVVVTPAVYSAQLPRILRNPKKEFSRP